MDVTREDHVLHAVEYVAENLPAGEPGRTKTISPITKIIILKIRVKYSIWDFYRFIRRNPVSDRTIPQQEGDKKITFPRFNMCGKSDDDVVRN